MTEPVRVLPDDVHNRELTAHVHPADWTYDNIATMRRQLKSMGLSRAASASG